MQVWRAPLRRCLLCVCRPAIPQTRRPFSQTVPVERQKAKLRNVGKGHKGPVTEQVRYLTILESMCSPKYPGRPNHRSANEALYG
jgi:hypothetical protein